MFDALSITVRITCVWHSLPGG